MWEWRVFSHVNLSNANFLKSDAFSKFEKLPVEERSDYYYDLSRIEYGLKERGNIYTKLFLPKLELKVLLEKRKSGLELWKKCVKTLITEKVDKNIGLPKVKIIELLAKSKQLTSPIISDNIDKVINLLNESNPIRVKVRKTRHKFSNSNSLSNSEGFNKQISSLEYTIVNLLNNTYYSVCVEGTNNSSVQHFIDKYFYDIQGFIMGYPEFISKVLADK